MDMAQMMERLLATINANQAKMKENQAKSDAARKADKEEMLAAIRANEEMTARMDAKIGSMHDELKSTIEENVKDAMQSMQAALKSAIKEAKFNREETMACQETMGAWKQKSQPQWTRRLRWLMIKKSQWRTLKYGRSRNRGKGVWTDGTWPRCAVRRSKTETWTRGVAGSNRIWSPPAEGQLVVQLWHDEEFCSQRQPGIY
jgi:regulator of replication initiation timing